MLTAACLSLCSCNGVQSALGPAGDEARQVATLFWTMTIGGLVIWAFVVLLSLYASRWKRQLIPRQPQDGSFSGAASSCR